MIDPMLRLEARRLSVSYALEIKGETNPEPADLVSAAEVIYAFLSGDDSE